ncbi:hypothetical protein PORY_001007 [Pneumocystis oryctolagi]|uniref:Uncharacterized protein n=1 Tax=Pneumocystis oryctolagi TaxID=42067 RepID=A0ACB7CCU3_9ASCO|nr:hypothetical protein PORY_001007 [Pneumocystis oryctolagi]
MFYCFFSRKRSIFHEINKIPFKSIRLFSYSPCSQDYVVRRTRFGGLPVYSDIKGGGTKFQTIIRRVEGNVHELYKKLVKELELKEKEAYVNHLTKHIIIKGLKVKQVKNMLTRDGF